MGKKLEGEKLHERVAVLCHPHDIVQLERMISVDCLW